MKISPHLILIRLMIVLFSTSFLLNGCVTQPMQPERTLDSPEHHVVNGYKLLMKERLDAAQREFDFALEDNPQDSSAYRGLGLVHGTKGKYPLAFSAMEKAMSYAKDRRNKALTHVGFMRLHILRKDEGWLGKVEDSFQSAISIIRELPEAYYYMGIAYKNAYRFLESRIFLRKVLEIEKSLVPEASHQYEMVKIIERASPMSEFGMSVAVLDKVTRAEISALLIREIGLDRTFSLGGAKDIGQKAVPVATPPDVRNHPYRADIETVIQMKLDGLGPFPDGTFGPDESVTRAAFAVMIAGIIDKATGRDKTKRYPDTGIMPFKDISLTDPYFTAVMTCLERDLLSRAGEDFFYPSFKVSGGEVLWAMKKIKKELQSDTKKGE